MVIITIVVIIIIVIVVVVVAVVIVVTIIIRGLNFNPLFNTSSKNFISENSKCNAPNR